MGEELAGSSLQAAAVHLGSLLAQRPLCFSVAGGG